MLCLKSNQLLVNNSHDQVLEGVPDQIQENSPRSIFKFFHNTRLDNPCVKLMSLGYR